MDDYQKISLLLNFSNIVLLPLGIALYRFIKKWREENEKAEAEKRKRAELVEKLQIAMARDRLMQSGDFFHRLGAIPANVKQNLIEIGEIYTALGYNGDGHEALEKIKGLHSDTAILNEWYAKRGCHEREV